jgi:hypothetical protein
MGDHRDDAAEAFAKASEGEIGDHEHSERKDGPGAVAGTRRALVGPETAGLVCV